ncbi:MAG: hypothetical protein Q9227_002335 [Pyrenula ochraceoflavens]
MEIYSSPSTARETASSQIDSVVHIALLNTVALDLLRPAETPCPPRAVRLLSEDVKEVIEDWLKDSEDSDGTVEKRGVSLTGVYLLEPGVVAGKDLDDDREKLVEEEVEIVDEDEDEDEDDSTCPPGHVLLAGAAHSVSRQIGYSSSHSEVGVFPSGEP